MEQPTAPGTEAGSDPTAAQPRPSGLSCLLVHGLGGGPFELEPLAEALRDSGWPVHRVTLPGHDEPGPVMPPSRWQDWYQTVERRFDELASGGRPVAVIGFSTGATLVLRLALDRPVARIALLAPFLAIRHTSLMPMVRPETVLRWLCRFVPDLPRKAPPIRDPQARREFDRLQPYRTFSMPATLSAVELIRLVEPRLHELTLPTLIVQGQRDSVVEPSGASRIHRTIASPAKSLVWLPRSDHLVAWDYDRLRVVEAVEAFLADAEGGAPRPPRSAPHSSSRP